MAGSGSGAKWLSILIIYFIFLTIIVTIVTPFTGGIIDTEFNVPEDSYCSDPRLIYEPYSINAVGSTDDFDRWSEKRDYLASLECSQSRGVLNENICNAINGCNWDVPTLPWYKKLFGYEVPEATCLGDINATYYGFETTTYAIGTEEYIAFHNNTNNVLFSNRFGSICDHPNVIESETNCNLFSCSWNTPQLLSELQISNFEPSKNPVTILSQVWNTIKGMFTLEQNFGLESDFGNQLINIFLFWLPLLMVILAVYVMVRA